MSRLTLASPLLVLVAAGACADREAAPTEQLLPPVTLSTKEEEGAMGGAAREAPAAAPAPMQAADGLARVSGAERAGFFGDLDGEKKVDKGGGGAPGEPEAPRTRSWFPESFLWMPLVETDATGAASVQVAVPDSLTTWRVLGLAWSKGGAQAGDVLSVLSTKDAYVDVVVPGGLYSGDEADLPVQVVNTTASPLSAALEVSVTGGSGAGGGELTVGAGGTAVRTVRVRAAAAGTLAVHAGYGTLDAVERSVPVRPAGRPVEAHGSGAVGGAPSAIPGGAPGPDGELVVQVWAGAEAVIAEEVGGGEVMPLDVRILPPGWGLADRAYDFALAQAATALPADVVDPDALRTRRIRAWQPLVKAGRAPDVRTACLLAEALRGADAESPEGLLLDRMIDTVRAAQAPDGSWSTGAPTIDGELLQAASCARAAGADDAVRLRAEGFFARNRARLEDPVLAAQALASGAVTDPTLVAALRTTLEAALTRDADGAWLAGGGTLRSDGTAVSREEATAAAALALADNQELASALATALLSARRPWGGWGDGRTNLLVLRALDQVFDPQTGAAEVSVSFAGGPPLATGSLASGGARALTLRVPWGGAEGALQVSAASPAPGLVYSWRSRSYGPWAATVTGGVELAVRAPSGARVGEIAAVGVDIATPSGVRARVAVGLPAGVHADPAGMDRLVSEGAFASWQDAEGSVLLVDVADGGWSGTLPVVPALGGRLSSGPSRLLVDGGASAVSVPSVWTIGG